MLHECKRPLLARGADKVIGCVTRLKREQSCSDQVLYCINCAQPPHQEVT